MDREATPTLLAGPGIDLDAYKHQLIERFSNAEVRDTVARLCAESSDRIPKWLLPVVRENLAAGGDVTLSAAIVASWARYAEAVDEQGEPIESSTGSRTGSPPPPGGNARNRSPSSPTPNSSVTWPTTSVSPPPYLDALTSLHDKGSRATLQMLVG